MYHFIDHGTLEYAIPCLLIIMEYAKAGEATHQGFFKVLAITLVLVNNLSRNLPTCTGLNNWAYLFCAIGSSADLEGCFCKNPGACPTFRVYSEMNILIL